jgi:hypothetical protein
MRDSLPMHARRPDGGGLRLTADAYAMHARRPDGGGLRLTADACAAALEQANASLVRELGYEREHIQHTLRHQREHASRSEDILRHENQRLRQLLDVLEADTSARVTLKMGGGMTLAQ